MPELAHAAPAVEIHDVYKTYPTPAGPFAALAGVDLALARGEFLAVVGASGSGKSTLLNLLAGIDRPSRGAVSIAGTDLGALSEAQLSRWRGRTVGIVFQFFQLLPTLTALENVLLAMDFVARWPRHERRARGLDLLARLGVSSECDKLPQAMSGGQQQRVAVARALANSPALLLADEPTGNLDTRNAQELLELLAQLAADGQTIVMVTHEPRALKYATRTLRLADGCVIAPAASAAPSVTTAAPHV